MTASSQLRVLTINEDENKEAVLFRLEKGWTLHFVLGPSLAGKHVRIFVNHPSLAKSGPNRQNYRELVWGNLSSCKADVYDNFAEVQMVLAGSFNYFFTINGSDKEAEANGCGYFLVDPVLRCGQFDERIPLDAICCQTVLAKSLGPFSEWEDRLSVSRETGYNMIHMTPIQELGISNSSYCIKDQLKLNSAFCGPRQAYSLSDVQTLVEKMCKEWEVLSLTDLVFNHTANESNWLADHPECAYNLINSPHLKPAYLLDRIIWKFSEEIAKGVWSTRGIPPELCTEQHLKILRETLANEVIPKYKIHEYFMIHVDETVSLFKDKIMNKDSKKVVQPVSTLLLIPDPQYRRLKASVDLQQAAHLFDVNHPHIYDEAERVRHCCINLKHRLEELNKHKFEEVQSHLEAAVNNVIANTRYRFVDSHGPRIPKVLVEDEPIMWNYFTLPSEERCVEEEEKLMHTDWGAYCMAHNGWVMGDDPLRDFAAPDSNVYLRRELIPWGDNVKLRYGKVPTDCLYLWEHMANYVRETARIFHGVRLDNCHSTPIHVAEYMLDEGRKVRPDLYVIAELFTSSELLDNVFINRLGLNSLIREGLNASDPHDLGRLVHRYGGGSPVGAFFQPPARPLMPSIAHAMLLDQTHDNPSPIEKRSAFDLLPSSALIAMACCATGSNRGYDEMVPHHINVVKENRLYTKWNDKNTSKVGHNSSSCGINAAKKVLNKLHQDLATKGFNQVYVDQIKGDVVAVTRHNPISHQSVILAARTSFTQPVRNTHTEPFILTAPGIIDEILFEGKVLRKDNLPEFQKDFKFINGIQNHVLSLKENIKVHQSEMVEACTHSSSQFAQEVEFVSFPPGSIIAFKVSLHHNVKKDVLAIRQTLSQFGYRMRTLSARHVSELSTTELENLILKLSQDALNRVLYRCDAEERDDGKGFGVYNLPDYGDLPYCGLHGVVSVLRTIRAGNELGNPLCNNIRSGDWLCDYMANRLKAFPTTEGLGIWFEKVFSHLIKIPRYLIPCYFDAIVTGVYLLVEEVAWAKMSKFVSTGSTFVRTLAMGSLQLCSFVPSAKLPTLSPHLAPPTPPQAVNQTGLSQQACLSLAAGLPHFASGIWRSWGRDTFISLRGLLLLTGRYEEARLTILAYAGCLRHGLMPNLLAEGIHARYNCRDAIWWWLYCIQQYCHLVPSGTDILQDTVARLYPNDDPHPESPGACDMALHEVIQEAVQRHATGISFREHNAGPAIDNEMTDPGFNVECGIDWATGFVYGGNAHNSGTWMDKMGSSEKAGNKGQPATPRDGSAIELVGLCKATVRWLADLYREGIYPNEGVTVNKQGQTKNVSFQEWNQLILRNFEKFFWVSSKPDKDNEPRPDLINKRGIYKDSVGASAPWTDYQLRPNVPIAMVVAPEMFTPANAWLALENTGKHLLGPLGMKTLDPSDWAYHGDYDNSNDSHDKKVAKGWNYHQGPEWVWLTGFFLRAKLYFATVLESSEPGTMEHTMDFVRDTLARHNVHVQNSAWQSLPELTNSNGKHCPDSCEAQAWSVACILEVLYDLEQL